MQMPHNIIQRIVRALCRKKKKKMAQCFPNTELTDLSWKDSLNCEGDTLLCLSFSSCVMGKYEQGIFVWVTFQSRICVSCSSPINCHRAIAGWFASMGIPFPAWLTALFHVVCWELWRASRRARLSSSPFGYPTISSAAVSQISQNPNWQSGRHREDTDQWCGEK